MTKIKFQYPQGPKYLQVKKLLVINIFFLLSSLLGAQNIFDDIVFRINSQSFRADALAKKDCHYIECYAIQVDIEDLLTLDTTEWYYASFDTLFRPSNEKFISSDEEIIIEYVYNGNKTYKTIRSAYKKLITDSFYTTIKKATECFENGLRVSVKSQYYLKEKNNVMIFDTMLYNESRLPIFTYHLWVDKQTLDIDTLISEYSYDKMGNLIESKMSPIGDASILLKYTNGSATPLFSHDIISYPYNPIATDSIRNGTLLGRLGFYEQLPIPNHEPALFKINDRLYDISMDLSPDRRTLKANRNWIEDIIYEKDCILPNKISVLYWDVLNVYKFKYFNKIPLGFR